MKLLCLALVVAFAFVAAAARARSHRSRVGHHLADRRPNRVGRRLDAGRCGLRTPTAPSAHKFGAPFTDNGVGQLTWTKAGIVVDSNYRLFLLTQAGKRVKIGGVGDQTFRLRVSLPPAVRRVRLLQ